MYDYYSFFFIEVFSMIVLYFFLYNITINFNSSHCRCRYTAYKTAREATNAIQHVFILTQCGEAIFHENNDVNHAIGY